MASEERPVKHVADIIGEWGRYQFNLNAFSFILRIIVALHIMGYTFYAFEHKFWCSDVPKDLPNKTDSMKCHMYSNPNQSCTEWTYDRSEFNHSITTEFNLVCGRSHWASISQSVFMMGYVVSGLVFAHYSDKYGRRPIIWLSFIIEIASILGCALSVNIYMFTIFRFFLGLGSCGRGRALDTIIIELCGPKYRSDICILNGLGWVLGYTLVPLIALWLQNFRYMQLLSFAATLPMIVWFYFLDESPRWLITNGHTDRAQQVLRKALIMNGKSESSLKEKLNDLSIFQKRTQTIDSEKNHSVLDLFKSPKLRKMTLIFCYFCIIEALVYYGFSFNMSDFGGNFYITFLLSGLIELPSQLLSTLFLRFIGRPKLFCVFLCMTGMSCVAIILSNNQWFRIGFALVGKFGVTSSWNIMAIFSSELFPTVIRNTASGAFAVVGRIGSISAPFMKDLAIHITLSGVMSFYAVLTIFGGILALLLPETKGKEIPDTIEEAENL